jgi:HK97 family phage major capsid protein
MQQGLIGHYAQAKLDEALRQVATFGPLAQSPADLARRRQFDGFSVARVIEQCNTGPGVVKGELEYEVCAEAADAANRAHDPQRPIIPWGVFARRDLNVAQAGAGGYLVGTDVGAAIDVLRPWSVTARAGVSVISGLQANITLPRTVGNVTGYWLVDELTQATESTATVGSIALAPKTAGAYLEMSRQITLQAAQVEAFTRNELLRTVGTLVDQAVFNGSGSSGEPLGLLNVPGIGTQSGSSLAYDGVLAMQQTAAEANADDAAVAAIATPAVRKLLSGRERSTGSGFIWDRGQIAGMPGFATTDMPSGNLVVGAWPEIVFASWGPGFEISINPYEPTNFRKGIIGVRCFVSCDVAVRHAGAFVVASSIT